MKYAVKYNASKFKELITQLLKNAGYSQRSFCEQHGLDRSMLIRTMNGRNKPDRETVERFAKALSCSPEQRKMLYHSVGYLTDEEYAVFLQTGTIMVA